MTDTSLIELELCKPAPIIFGENGHLAVTDGKTVWIVVVTQEAMKATANPPDASLKRLARYARYYRDMAAAAIQRGEDQNGKVWIFEKDVLASPARRSFKHPGRHGRRLIRRVNRRSFPPVSVKLGAWKQTISTVTDVAKTILDDRWPLIDGPAQRALRLAIVTCFNDEIAPNAVRSAFLSAASEAHVEIADPAPVKSSRQRRVLSGQTRPAARPTPATHNGRSRVGIRH